jgi:hypothetical protein
MNDSIKTTAITHKGFRIILNWHYDPDMGPPWKEHDGHGPVSDWTTRDKRPGERVLCSDRSSHRFYDYAAAIEEAKRDKWDAPPYKTGTKGEQAARAVERDFQYLRDWCNDKWHWAGYTIKIEGQAYDESLWGIDSPSMDEFETEAIDGAKEWLDRELIESHRAACADIATVKGGKP